MNIAEIGIDSCLDIKCLYGGSCILNSYNRPLCACFPDFTGFLCETGRHVMISLIKFLLFITYTFIYKSLNIFYFITFKK